MIYSAPYIAIITVFLNCGGLAWNYRNNRTLQYTLIGVCAGLLVFFFGLRGFCFYDWNVYYPLYDKYRKKVQDQRWQIKENLEILLERLAANE